MIDELLKKFAESAQKWGWEESDTQPSQDVKTAKSQLLAEILKVIGEDEPVSLFYERSPKIKQQKVSNPLGICRNKLKAEYRTKFKELFKEIE